MTNSFRCIIYSNAPIGSLAIYAPTMEKRVRVQFLFKLLLHRVYPLAIRVKVIARAFAENCSSHSAELYPRETRSIALFADSFGSTNRKHREIPVGYG